MIPLRVGLDARLISGTAGGVEQFIIGLASGLSQLTDGDEEYSFLAYSDAAEWILPYLEGPCRLLSGPRRPQEAHWMTWMRVNRPDFYSLWRKICPISNRWKLIGLKSDGLIEKIGINVMHFTHQVGFLTRVPSIYHPHDLQHLHLPQFYSMSKRLIREIVYRTFCWQARLVAVSSTWMKNELCLRYHLPDEKVQVVPLAPVLPIYPSPTLNDLSSVRRKFSLPELFVFYPAQTWPHKNHLALLEALVILREKYGEIIPLVCCGKQDESFFGVIEDQIRTLRLSEQTQFLGFVSPLELKCLYQMSHIVVIPTRYEAASFPLWEAFLASVPTACSNVTSLPAQAGDAALIFDPSQPEAIAETILRLWKDILLREQMVNLGHKQVANRSWDLTARIFRAHYRKIARWPLTEEDRTLQSMPPLL